MKEKRNTHRFASISRFLREVYKRERSFFTRKSCFSSICIVFTDRPLLKRITIMLLLKFLVAVAILVACTAQEKDYEPQYGYGHQDSQEDSFEASHEDSHEDRYDDSKHKPYYFGYEIDDHHGKQHRHEHRDQDGTVKGSYGFVDEKGIQRQVYYVADHNGFRAQVITNEKGTESKNPADVYFNSLYKPQENTYHSGEHK